MLETENLGAYLSQRSEFPETKDLQKKIFDQDASLLCGLPMGLKDNIATQCLPTTCASLMLKGFIPSYDASVWEKLSKCGAILMGKHNMDEFGMGNSGRNSAYVPTLHPLNSAYVPGGSSSGSAAAVAVGSCFYALGSDTGGSVRQPAAFCGVVGLKPTYGRVSRYGLVAFASSLDQIGPLTRTVEDNAYVLEEIAFFDPRDVHSKKKENNFASQIGQGIKNLRIGLPEDFFMQGLDQEVKEKILKAAGILEEGGVQVSFVKLPDLSLVLSAYMALSCAEASSNLSRFDGVCYGFRAQEASSMEEYYRKTRSEGFGKEVKRRIVLGNYVLSEGVYEVYMQKARAVQRKLKNEMALLFEKTDLLLMPVAPTCAFLQTQNQSPMQNFLGDLYTVPANLCGLPALSLPAGKNKEGLPCALQLMGPCWSEALLYRVGAYLEECFGRFPVF